MKLRLVIADDHRLITDGIRAALADVDDIEIIECVHSGSQLLASMSRRSPDMVLVDVRMPGLDGLTCLERIRKSHPKARIAILSACEEEEMIQAAFRRGADAYITKSIDPRDLPSALRQTANRTFIRPFERGDAEAPSSNGHRGGSNDNPADLTDREVTVLRAVARGLSNGAISKELWVSQQTVKFHLSNIYRKLGVSNRTEAARHALREGLVSTVDD
jgi:DNA-binding NarL/FixJ family response regulator